jgi:hypothetical protein
MNMPDWTEVADALGDITDAKARQAVAMLLRQLEGALDDVQVRDLRCDSPPDDSALQDAYIAVDDTASALHVAWFGSDDGNSGGESTAERLVSRAVRCVEGR